MVDVLLGSSPKLTEFQKGKRQHGWRYFRITRKHINSYMATLRSRIPDKPNLRRDCQIRKPERKKNSFSAAGVGKQPKTVVGRNNFAMVFANFCTISSINSWKLRCFFLHVLSYVYIGIVTLTPLLCISRVLWLCFYFSDLLLRCLQGMKNHVFDSTTPCILAVSSHRV